MSFGSSGVTGSEVSAGSSWLGVVVVVSFFPPEVLGLLLPLPEEEEVVFPLSSSFPLVTARVPLPVLYTSCRSLRWMSW